MTIFTVEILLHFVGVLSSGLFMWYTVITVLMWICLHLHPQLIPLYATTLKGDTLSDGCDDNDGDGLADS